MNEDTPSAEHQLHDLDDVAAEFGVDLGPTLVEFLLARIAEDEAIARAASHQKVAGPLIGWNADSAVLTMINRGLDKKERSHIARHDPTRVLAECEAKRRIVEWAAPVLTNWPNAPEGFRYISDDGLDVLKILALPYADHPDYRTEWKP